MADSNSDCATCENSDLFQTALDNFPNLNISSEIKEISEITNDTSTPRSPRFEPTDGSIHHRSLPQECAKEHFQSSTPKRGQPVWKSSHLCGRLQSHTGLLIRLGDFRNSTKFNDTSENHSSSQQNSRTTSEARKAISAPNFSVAVREHRRQIILSPFSRKLRSIILQQESARKRERRAEMSRKAQRASLRV